MGERDELKSLMERCRESWKIPGIALAVIKEGKVIFSEGIGYRDVDKELAMNSDTIMPIASSTKPFATTAIAMLVDEGLVDWDTRVREYVPEFELKNEHASNHVTPRDLACHRTGVPRHDLMMYKTDLTIEELVKRIKYLDYNYELREKMQYQNQMFMTLGYLIEKVTGKKWTEFVYDRIFKPIGMSRSNFSITDSKKDDNYSKAYAMDKGVVEEIPLAFADYAGTAGAINSTLNDMSKWLLFHMQNGKWEGKQLVSEDGLKETHTQQIIIKDFAPFEFKEIDFSCYGLGWFLESYRGNHLIHHGGTIDGFQINVSFMPDEQIGLVLFTNLNRNMAAEAINYEVYDIMLGLPRIDWNKRFLDVAEQNRIAEEEELAAMMNSDSSTDDKNKPMSHPIEDYLGTYYDPGYGKLTIKYENNEFVVYYNGMILFLEHSQYDSFILGEKILDFKTFARFHMDIAGNIDIFEAGVCFDIMDKGIMFKKVSE